MPSHLPPQRAHFSYVAAALYLGLFGTALCIVLFLVWAYIDSAGNRHAHAYSDLVLSHDGLIALSTGGDGLQQWAVTPTGLQLNWTVASERSGEIALNAEADIAASIGVGSNRNAGSNTQSETPVHLWRLHDGQLLQTLHGSQQFFDALDISSDGQFIVAAGFDNTIWVWELQNGHLYRRLQPQKINLIQSMAFSPDSRLLAVGDSDGLLQVWNVVEGRLLHSWQGHNHVICDLEWSHDQQLLLSASWDATAKLWSTSNYTLIQTFRGHISGVVSAALSPNSSVVVTGSGAPGNPYENEPSDLTLRFWRVSDGQQLAQYEGHSNWIKALVFTPDGQSVFSASSDGTIKKWNVPSL
jgi:WD40 repeat protein